MRRLQERDDHLREDGVLYDRRLFAIHGQLSLDEHNKGRPLLSVLDVHKTGDMQPGEGFFELAESLGRDTSDDLKAWIAEVQRVYQHFNKFTLGHQ